MKKVSYNVKSIQTFTFYGRIVPENGKFLLDDLEIIIWFIYESKSEQRIKSRCDIQVIDSTVSFIFLS